MQLKIRWSRRLPSTITFFVSFLAASAALVAAVDDDDGGDADRESAKLVGPYVRAMRAMREPKRADGSYSSALLSRYGRSSGSAVLSRYGKRSSPSASSPSYLQRSTDASQEKIDLVRLALMPEMPYNKDSDEISYDGDSDNEVFMCRHAYGGILRCYPIANSVAPTVF